MEKQILDLNREQAQIEARNDSRATVLLTQEQIFSAQQEVLSLHMSAAVEEYLIQIVLASRSPSAYGNDLVRWISYGASPRGTIALDRCARAQAWLQGRDYVSPQDIQAVVFDTLRHRILLSFEAEAEGLSSDDVIHELIRRVPVA
jgi:MoxR-like ATPase